MALENVVDIYPLSPMQRLMLMSAVGGSDPSLLANRVRYEIRGDLDVALFREAWTRLVERHAALRTAILWDGLDQPVQVVRGRVELPFEEVDLSPLPPDARQARLAALAADDARPSFDLAAAPLLRCTLVRLGADRFELVWDIHHLVVDRWSHGTLFDELARIYRALVDGREPALAPAPGFGDYVAWLGARDEAAAERVWRDELAGFREPTPVVPHGERGRGSGRRTTTRALSPEASEQLWSRASGWRVTPTTLVLAALGLELADRNGRDDVVFGLTVSGRPADLDGVEETVGSFVNNVPVRMKLDADGTVGGCVRDLHRRLLLRQPHDHLSLAAIQDASDVPAHRALFDVLVVPNLAEHAEAAWPGLELRPLGATFDAAYPFVLGVGSEAGALALTLVHHDGFEGATELLERLAGRLEELAATGDDTRVDALLPGLSASPDSGAATVPPAAADEADAPSQGSLGDDVVRIWGEVLGRDRVAPDDDFFDLGGTSLQAAQILRRIERRTGRALSLSVLFRARTLGGLLEQLGSVPDAFLLPDIPPRPRDEPLPLSFAQERLWVLDRIEQESSLYNVPSAYRLTGPLRPELLRRSVELVVARHETLRTRYAARGGVPRQTALDPGEAELDWSEDDLGREADPSEVRARIDAEAAAPIDLERGPLFRVRMYRLGPEEHVLLFVLHHSISDVWSVGVLEREVSAAYAALSSGREPALAELPIQYADFAVWQRQHLQGETLEEQLSYWRERLEGVTPVELHTDRPRPAVQTFRGAVHRAVLEPELAASLKALSRAEGVTLFMTLMAAFHVLLHRYSASSDVTVGTPYSGRNRSDVEELIGMFVNTVLIRSRPAPDMAFRTLLAEVAEAATEAHAHHELPFEKLVEELQPERDLTRNPLFQVLFALQDEDRNDLELGPVRTARYDVTQETSKFDLSLYLQEAKDASGEAVVQGVWEYATDLFDAETVVGMQRHFENLLAAIVADPDRAIGALPMVDAAEARGLLGGGPGDPPTEAPTDPLFAERFAEHVARTPDRIAVADEHGSLSFEELDRRANRLARHLLALGVEPESLVGVHLHRSVDLVVALLAIVKSGAAYLPLDPEYPAERLAYMLSDAEASVLLTRSDLADTLPGFGGRTVCLDRTGEVPGACSDEPVAAAHGRERLAYTIYTSGSTGRPKGVEVTHGNVAHLTTSIAQRPGLSDADVLLARSPITFDMSIVELFATLGLGTRVVLAGPDDVATGARLGARLADSGATVVQATPANFQMLYEAGWEGDPELRIFVGGEALSLDVARRLVATCGEVWNLYGPTEATVWATCWRVPDDVEQIRIGTPMGASRALVLDAHLRPLPAGVVGDLYVGGAGVARGYRNRPDLTAASFVENPFPWIPGPRLYRTGDLACLRHDGTLEFLGRGDNQVQLRGFRIELGEIESVLAEHPDVQRAVIGVVDEGTADARLVAYLVLERGASLTVSEVRRYLRGRLPDYMVPGLVLELDALPTTPSGKVDRKALPALLTARGDTARDHTPPETPEEILLAEVWAELLGAPRVGRHDNFFQLGGHSLLSLRAVAALEEAHGLTLDPRAMFFQTLEQLAAQLQPLDVRS